MGSVEVDAKIRGRDERHSLSRRDTVPYARSGTDIVLDLEKLNPDVDGDGKVSASELKIYNLLRAHDASGDGKLNVAELYKGLEALTKVEKKRSMFTKGFFVMSAVSLIQVLLIVGLVAGIVVALKDQFVADNTLTGSSGAILKTAEATEELPLYVLPVLPTQQRGTLSTISITYADASLHEWMVENGLIGENDTAVEYPRVEETAAVLSFKKYNDTAADLGVAPGEPGGPHRVIRILNGAATLLMPRNDGRVIEAPLCAGKVSCASYTVEASLADELRAQATGNLTFIGVEVPTDRRLAEDTASVKEEGRKLFDGDVCEDAADELVAKMTEEALGRTFSSCAALKDIVGACEHEQAKMHCPQTCGLCAALGAQEDMMNRRQLDKCVG